MKNTILFFLVLIPMISAYTQAVCYRDFDSTTDSYLALDTFPTNQIADDFGPRDLGDDWHGGIDFNSASGNADFGDMLLTPEAGTFPDVNRIIRSTASQIRYQVVDSGDHRYAFVHMFDKHQTERWYNDSTVYINYCIGQDNNRWGMVMLIDGDTTVLGQRNNAQIIFLGDTLTVTNTLDQYSPIGVLGNSGQYTNSQGVLTDYIAHLHLNTIPDNQNTSGGDATNSDPCEFIHYDEPNYDFTIWSQLSNNNVSIKYPGSSATKIAVRAQMSGEPENVNRYDHLMDVNTVELKISRTQVDTFGRIDGKGEESIISLGAKLGEPIINHQQNSNYPGTIHQWTRTGINSCAYNGDTGGANARDPWDDYYFTDFFARIHTNDPMDGGSVTVADCPENARYKDGEYELFAEITTVRDSTFRSDTLEFVIDNFKPYIDSIQVFIGPSIFDDDKLIYDMYWECSEACSGNDSGMGPVGGISENIGNITQQDIEAGMMILVRTSEVMQHLDLSIEAYGNMVDAEDIFIDPLQGLDGPRWWWFTINIEDYISLEPTGFGEDIKLFFEGNDYVATGETANDLLNLSTKFFPEGEGTNSPCVEVPTRTQSGWSNTLPTGTEEAHHFSFPMPDYCSADEEITDGEIVLPEGGVVVLDRFKPFVQYVRADFLFSQPLLPIPLYEKEWVCDPVCGGILLENLGPLEANIADTTLLDTIYQQGISFTVRSSEPLDSLILNLPSVGQTLHPVNVTEGHNGIDWEFLLEAEDVSYSPDQSFPFHFTGVDQNHNQLLELQDWSTADCVEIPVRHNSDTWVNDDIAQGTDETHGFYISCGAEEEPPGIVQNTSFYDVTISITHEGACFEVGEDIVFASANDSEDGSITIEVTGAVAPYSFYWSNGETTQNIDNLNPGDYCVTVIDQYCCEGVFCYTIGLCSPMSIVEPKINNPTTCTSNDGSIWFKFGDVDGGVEPYTFTWSNGYDGMYLNDNLSAGNYYVTVTDANGCTAEASYELMGQGTPQIFAGADEAACPGADNGSAVAEAIAEDGSNNFFYQWSNGATGTDLTGVAAGNYCVTVTNLDNGCHNIACVTVEEFDTGGFDAPLVVGGELKFGCDDPTNPTAYILVEFEGGIPPFDIIWDDPALYGLTPGPLAEGTYCVSVTDRCENVASECFEIKFLEASIVQLGYHCAGEGQLLLDVSGGKEPYTYSWSTGETTQNIGNLFNQEYCVTVTDASECQTSICHLAEVKDYVLEEELPCVGFNDGQVVLNFFNPEDDEIEVFLGEVEIFVPDMEDPEVVIAELSPLPDEYELTITIGECEYSHTIQLGEKDLTNVFSGDVNKEEQICYYDVYCDDVLVQENGHITNMTFNYDAATELSGLFASCCVPAYCDDINETVHCEKIDRETVKAFEYYMILIYALNYSPFSEDYILNLLDNYAAAGLRPCDKVRYCPANLRIESTISGVQGLGSTAQQNPDNPDCWVIDCFIGTHSFCVSDITPEIINPDDIAIDICFPVGWRVYQLILWYDDLMLNADFAAPGNTLRDFLDMVMGDPDLLEKSLCADVVFCKSNMQFLYTNIYSIDCSPVEIGCAPGGGVITDEVCVWDPYIDLVAWCPGEEIDGCGTTTPVMFSTEFIDLLPNNPEGPIDDDIDIIYQMVPEGGNTTFIGLGESLSEGKTIPKGLFSSESGTIYNDFTHYGQVINQSPLPLNVVKMIDDWDEEKIVYVESITNGAEYKIAQEDLFGKWEMIVSANDYLDILSLSIEGDDIYLGGSFSGTLSYDNASVSSSSSHAGFMMKVSPSGSLIDYHIVEDLDPSSKMFVSETGGKVSFIGKPQSTQVIADGTVVELSTSENLASISFDPSGQATFSEEVSFDPTIHMVKHSVASDANPVSTFITRGAGEIKLDGQEIHNNPEENNIMVFTLDGELLKYLSVIRFSGSVSDNISLAYGENNSLYMGITFEGIVAVNGEMFNSNGGKDILILKFSEIGVLEKYLTFGGADDETVMEMMFDNGVLYFGGEFLGPTPERRIGRYHFSNSGSSTQTAYVSYVLEEDFTPVNGSTPPQLAGDVLSEQNMISGEKQTKKRSLSFVEVFPNPVANDLYVRITTGESSEFDITVRNSLGSVVWRSSTIIDGEQVIAIPEVTTLPSGVYLVEIQNEKGDMWNFKQIKH